MIENITNVSNVGNFSIKNELNKLIPDNLGSMKKFIVTIISEYYNKLHPIIWMQIFKGMMNDIFIDLPMTTDEIYSFLSKHLLLNSGPFILKILQMIRPILTDDLARKYNITKLTYPLLSNKQVDIILKHVLIDYDMIKIVYNKSASVGHVCVCYNVKNPNEKFVVKIIKPLAIAQSCWEYSVLKDVFPQNSCESNFVKNTLKSNANEMNVNNEIENLYKGYDAYNTDYKQMFGLDIDAKLTAIQNKDDIVKKGTWFALAMTFAPGVPVADLVESKMLEKDTKYRANLHRCIDLLISKFFFELIHTGFYHGDLHAGNMFYSFKHKQITLIDFGAVGHLDLFGGDESIFKILSVIIMGTFYNFDGILDLLTDILNEKCKGDGSINVDKNTPEYIAFKKELIYHKIKLILANDKIKKNSKEYIKGLNSSNRLENEKTNDDFGTINNDDSLINQNNENSEGSIYDYLEMSIEPKETVVENVDMLPSFVNLEHVHDTLSFDKIMEKIVTFFAGRGVNIPVKFSEFNEFQKAYALLMGVVAKTGYNGYRTGKAINAGIVNVSHIVHATKVIAVKNILSLYLTEKSKYDELYNHVKKEWDAHNYKKMNSLIN
jgi:septum formation topological specificity factor MinE